MVNNSSAQEYFDCLQSEFEHHKNLLAAQKMSAYMKHLFLFYGISSPVRKSIVKKVFEGYKFEPNQFIQLIKLLWAHPHRENQYVLFDIGFKWEKKLEISHLNFFEELIQLKSWWDTVDGIAPHFLGSILLKMTQDERRLIARKWNSSANIWLQRSSIIFQLKYKDKTDFELAKELILNRRESKEFFVRKAAGWLLRERAKTDAESVLDFVKNNELSSLTRREALKHIGDLSF